MARYIALIRDAGSGCFVVNFPDFPGCITRHPCPTLDEARRMAADMLSLHVAGLVEQGDWITPPSTLDDVMADPENHDAVAFYVEVDADPAKNVRIAVMLPEDLVLAIDRVTTNRSRFLAEAARSKLGEAA